MFDILVCVLLAQSVLLTKPVRRRAHFDLQRSINLHALHSLSMQTKCCLPNFFLICLRYEYRIASQRLLSDTLQTKKGFLCRPSAACQMSYLSVCSMSTEQQAKDYCQILYKQRRVFEAKVSVRSSHHYIVYQQNPHLYILIIRYSTFKDHMNLSILIICRNQEYPDKSLESIFFCESVTKQ